MDIAGKRKELRELFLRNGFHTHAATVALATDEQIAKLWDGLGKVRQDEITAFRKKAGDVEQDKAAVQDGEKSGGGFMEITIPITTEVCDNPSRS